MCFWRWRWWTFVVISLGYLYIISDSLSCTTLRRVPSQRCVKRFLLLLALCLSSQLHSWRSLVGLLLLRCQITQDLGRLRLLLSWEPCLFNVSSNHLKKNAELQNALKCLCLLISVPAYSIPSGVQRQPKPIWQIGSRESQRGLDRLV